MNATYGFSYNLEKRLKNASINNPNIDIDKYRDEIIHLKQQLNNRNREFHNLKIEHNKLIKDHKASVKLFEDIVKEINVAQVTNMDDDININGNKANNNNNNINDYTKSYENNNNNEYNVNNDEINENNINDKEDPDINKTMKESNENDYFSCDNEYGLEPQMKKINEIDNNVNNDKYFISKNEIIKEEQENEISSNNRNISHFDTKPKTNSNKLSDINIANEDEKVNTPIPHINPNPQKSPVDYLSKPTINKVKKFSLIERLKMDIISYKNEMTEKDNLLNDMKKKEKITKYIELDKKYAEVIIELEETKKKVKNL